MKTMHNWVEYIIDVAILIALFMVVKIGAAISSFTAYFIPSYLLVSLQGVHDVTIQLFQMAGAGALCGIAIYRFYKELKKKD